VVVSRARQCARAVASMFSLWGTVWFGERKLRSHCRKCSDRKETNYIVSVTTTENTLKVLGSSCFICVYPFWAVDRPFCDLTQR
jgi:hypothetical protein